MLRRHVSTTYRNTCNRNKFVPGKYTDIITSWQNRMRACMGDTFIGGKRNQAIEKQTEMIAMWRQPLRQPSPLRSTNARERHPHYQRGKGHKARICATDCGSPHQTSVPVSCRHSPQLVSQVIASTVHASTPGIPQELNPPRTQQNTQRPPTPKPPPFSSCHIWQEIVSTPVDKCKQISVSKGQISGQLLA